jgi:hypothetical protein
MEGVGPNIVSQTDAQKKLSDAKLTLFALSRTHIVDGLNTARSADLAFFIL